MFLQGYSQMEIATQTTTLTKTQNRQAIAKNKRERLTCCGTPAIMPEIKVVDSDNKEVGKEVVGELITRGPHMVKGY